MSKTYAAVMYLTTVIEKMNVTVERIDKRLEKLETIVKCSQKD